LSLNPHTDPPITRSHSRVTIRGPPATPPVPYTTLFRSDPTTVTGGTSGSGNEDTVIGGQLIASDPDRLSDGTVYTVTGAPANGVDRKSTHPNASHERPTAADFGANSNTVTNTDDASNTR